MFNNEHVVSQGITADMSASVARILPAVRKQPTATINAPPVGGFSVLRPL
jgi:hypothetical protein